MLAPTNLTIHNSLSLHILLVRLEKGSEKMYQDHSRYRGAHCHCRKQRPQHSNRCNKSVDSERLYNKGGNENCIKTESHQSYRKPFITDELKYEHMTKAAYDNGDHIYSSKQWGCGCARCQRGRKRKRYICSCYEQY